MKKHIILLLATSLACSFTVQAESNFASNMKQRLSAVIEAKDSGLVGEGVDGFLHLRNEDTSEEDNATVLLRAMVASENKARKSLFASLAKKTKGSSTEAAKIFAKAMVSKGKKGHWFKSSKGAWKKK